MKNKQFKLIKTYPNSYALGFTVKSDGLGQYVSYNPLIILQASEVENYPEFWEEIKEYDFEILKISSKKENNIYKEGTIITFLDTEEPFDEGWQKWWNIYSIKRKSDGEVFCIGDKIQNFEREGRVSNIISTISINKNSVWLQVGDVGGCVLGYAKKRKTPLFTTLDGKDIYEGDEYYYVSNIYRDYTDAIYPKNLIRLEISTHIAKYNKILYTSPSFSTKEAAEKYVDENKPQFSKKQVINILRGLDRELNEYEDMDINYYSYIERYKDEK